MGITITGYKTFPLLPPQPVESLPYIFEVSGDCECQFRGTLPEGPLSRLDFLEGRFFWLI